MATNGVVATGREAVPPSIPPAPSPAVVSSPAPEVVAQEVAASGVSNDAVRVSLSLRRSPVSGEPAAEAAVEPTEEDVDEGKAAKELDERTTENAQKTVVRFGPEESSEANSAELSFKVVNPSTGETLREYPNHDAAASGTPRGSVVNDVA